ncbi:MAG: prolipoprotein diacylglyceryl transferase [bacterium]
MHPNLVNLFGVQITTYGLMVALAFASLWLAAVARGNKLGYPQEFIQNLITVIVLSAFASARALHVVVDWGAYSANPWQILLSRDGYVYLGGFVGAVCMAAWYTRRNRQSVWGIADLFAPYLAMAQGIGRIGCLLFGCCYGRVCELPWAVRFPEDSPAFYDHLAHGWLGADAHASLPVHPTQVYMSLFNFVHFGILLFIRQRQTFRGQVAVSYLMIYSAGRFVLEYFRGDYRGGWMHLSTSQIISILLFGIGLAGFAALRRMAMPPDTVRVEAGEASVKGA